MVSYNYLGYGVTNSEGVAHLDHDADGEPIDHSYTGVGAGEIDVLASLDNPIVDGSIVSETLSVWDTVWYDKSDANWKVTGGTSDGLSFENGIRTVYLDSNFMIFYANNDNNFTGNFKIEFDIVSFDALWNMRIYTTTNNNFTSTELGASQNSHIEIICDNDVATVYCDGVAKKNPINTSVGVDLGFRVEQEKTLQFKDFKVYNI